MVQVRSLCRQNRGFWGIKQDGDYSNHIRFDHDDILLANADKDVLQPSYLRQALACEQFDRNADDAKVKMIKMIYTK